MTPEHHPSLLAANLRDEASDRWRDRDWSGLLTLIDSLRQDALWPVFWCALCAVGARYLGRDDAQELLHEAIRGGFVESTLLRADLVEAFGADEGWAEMAAAIAANQPPQPFVLTGWPIQEPAWPLNLCQLPAAREEVLLAHLPQRQPAAWATALATLNWVATRWVHANHRAHGQDAAHILDRVASGERFACPEYATVLSQSLNAQRVPARCLRLTVAAHHGGIGRAHVVSEAWIDEWGKWVVLDGQNGLYWCDAAGRPLGLAELRHEGWHSGQRPDAVCVARPVREQRIEAWWQYFAGPSTVAGRLLVPAGPGLMCEGRPLAAQAIQPDSRGLYPQLDLPSVGLAAVGSQPALLFGSIHPYTAGFDVCTGAGRHRLGKVGAVWPLGPASPASHTIEHTIEVAVVTEYGGLAAHQVSYRTA